MKKKHRIILVSWIIFACLLIAAIGIFVYTLKLEDSSQSTASSTTSITSSLAAPEQKETTAAIQESMNNLAFSDENQAAVSLAELRSADKPTLVMFWASWCPDCQAQLPIIAKLYENYQDKVNFVLINLVDNSREKLGAGQAYFADKGYPFTYYYDNDLLAAKSVDVNFIPTIYILDKEGQIQYAYETNLTEETLSSNLNAVL